MSDDALSRETVDKALQMLKTAIDKLEQCAQDLNNTLEPVAHILARASVSANLKAYNAAMYTLDVADEIKRIGNITEGIIAERVTKRMQQDDIEELRVDGYIFKPATKTYVNVTEANKLTTLNWLKSNDATAHLVSETFNANALRATITAMRESGKAVPGFINVFEKATLARKKGRAT